MKRIAAVIAVLGLVLAGCGEKTETLSASSSTSQGLNVMLDWFPNADHVGLYEALANGDFARAGLNVHVEVPSDPSLPLKLLAAGKVDVAISYEPEVMLARAQGLAARLGRGDRAEAADLDRLARLQAHHQPCPAAG